MPDEPIRFTDSQRRLFQQAATLIRSRPNDFVAAWQWVSGLAESRTDAICLATYALLDEPPVFEAMEPEGAREAARRVLLVAWVLTDPNTLATIPPIGDLSDWAWGAYALEWLGAGWQADGDFNLDAPFHANRLYLRTVLLDPRIAEWERLAGDAMRQQTEALPDDLHSALVEIDRDRRRVHLIQKTLNEIEQGIHQQYPPAYLVPDSASLGQRYGIDTDPLSMVLDRGTYDEADFRTARIICSKLLAAIAVAYEPLQAKKIAHIKAARALADALAQSEVEDRLRLADTPTADAPDTPAMLLDWLDRRENRRDNPYAETISRLEGKTLDQWEHDTLIRAARDARDRAIAMRRRDPSLPEVPDQLSHAAEDLAALRNWCLKARAQAGGAAGSGAEEVQGTSDRRRGRLTKDEAATRQTLLLATLRQHPTMKDDLPKLAASVGVSESTARRWLKESEDKYNQSAATEPTRASVQCVHCDEPISGNERCATCGKVVGDECMECHTEIAHPK